MIAFQQEAIRVARRLADIAIIAGIACVCAWAIVGYFG
jgi:hypothetical protein